MQMTYTIMKGRIITVYTVNRLQCQYYAYIYCTIFIAY